MKAFASYVEDLKYALSNDSVEIEAPVPNEKFVGITVQKKEDLPPVLLREALTWEEYLTSDPLVIPLGIDEFGNRQMLDIAKTPHMLVAGTTGSGKSTLMHTLINALAEKNGPDTLRFIFGDPKRTELMPYKDLPHLLTAPITDAKKALRALTWAIKEMERRYDILESEKRMNIASYHKHVYQPAKIEWEQAGALEKDQAALPEALPYIVIVIDELSDFIHAYPHELERCLIRLAQMSRAVGIHMILTTQRPSVNVITGSLKANIPTRIAMAVASQVDSRTIIDITGAEKLRGSGDILFQSSMDPKTQRIQSLYVSEDEVTDLIKHWTTPPSTPISLQDTLDLSDNQDDYSHLFFAAGTVEGEDDLYEDARIAVIEAGKASTSYLQRSLRVGYSRAARLMDLLEEGGVIGPQIGSKPREVLTDDE
jgi:S-DNA-T family DNA segregation ATPase FtsK/SpoIIIE